MQTITMTELRTKPKQLLSAIREGKSVDLIHRSQVVGEIRPKIAKPKKFDPVKMAEIVSRLNLKPLSYKGRERRYRKHLMKKYGKGLS